MKLFKLTLISLLLPCLGFAQNQDQVQDLRDRDNVGLGLVASQTVSGTFGSMYFRSHMEKNPKKEFRSLHRGESNVLTMNKVEEMAPAITPHIKTTIDHKVLLGTDNIKFSKQARSLLYSAKYETIHLDKAMLKRITSKVEKGDIAEISYSHVVLDKGLFTDTPKWQRSQGGLKLKNTNSKEVYENLKNLQKQGNLRIDGIHLVKTTEHTQKVNNFKEITKMFGEGENKQALAYLEQIAANEAKSPGTNFVSHVYILETVPQKAMKKMMKYVVEPLGILATVYTVGSIIVDKNDGLNRNGASIFNGNRYTPRKEVAEVTKVTAKKNRATAQ